MKVIKYLQIYPSRTLY